MGEGTFLREFICLRRKKKGKSKVLSGRFCFLDSEAEQRALPFLYINCSNLSPGGGGNYHIYRYGMCHFWGAFFRAENKFGVSFFLNHK